MVGPIEVDDPASIMGEHDEDEEDAERGGRNREEVNRHKVADMVVRECSPGLRGRFPPSRHPPGDGPLRDVDSEFQEFAVHAGCAPQDVGMGDPANQFAYLAILAWLTGTALPGEASPVRGEALSRPTQHGLRLDNEQGLSPVPPRPGKEEPEESITVPKFRPSLLSMENGELLAEGEILQREIRAQPAGSNHKGYQPQEGRDHGWKCRVLPAGKSTESTRTACWRSTASEAFEPPSALAQPDRERLGAHLAARRRQRDRGQFRG